MRVTLKVCDGPATGLHRVILAGASLRIGRSENADFVIGQDDYLSGIHFLLTNHQGSVYISDLKSRNGLFVNGVRVETAVLQEGDEITAGHSRFTVHFAGELKPEGLDELQFAVLCYLCRQPGKLYALIDAAHGDEVLTLMHEHGGQYECLYEGNAARDLASYAPYLAALPPGSALMRALIRQGWSRSWASYFVSRQPFAELRQHFQRFLTVQTPEGKSSLFRFYDPRVLRSYLPTLQDSELAEFWGPLESVCLEDEDPANVVRFSAREPCRGEVIRLHSGNTAVHDWVRAEAGGDK